MIASKPTKRQLKALRRGQTSAASGKQPKRAKPTHGDNEDDNEGAELQGWGNGDWAKDIATDEEGLMSEEDSGGEPASNPEMDESENEDTGMQEEYDEEGNFVKKPLPPGEKMDVSVLFGQIRNRRARVHAFSRLHHSLDRMVSRPI